ncbi:MAG: S8 family serine peptidase [Chloroflexi bacterium]|nr:S8 family serine peptidase [Chloroflexota bacterium]
MNNHLQGRVKQLAAISLTIAAVGLLWLALSAGGNAPTVLAQTGGTPTPQAATEPVDGQGVENATISEGKIKPPQYPNMDSDLNRIIEQVQSGQFSAQVAAASAPIHDEQSVAVTLYITEGYAQDLWDWLEENGASPRNIGTDYIEAYIPVSLLPDASQQEGVISVRTIIPPQPAQGAVVSEGVEAHGVPAWHAGGIKGSGVKIGIIDAGFKGFAELMGTELPSTVEARCYTAVGVFTSSLTDCIPTERTESTKLHGTAVTEAAFDIAPEADYYIANVWSFGDLLETVEWMESEGVDVVNMSLGFSFHGPGDGTTPYSNSPLKTVDAAVRGGIIWVNAAGNQARANWFGNYSDTDTDNVHDFSATTKDECNGVRIELDPLEGFTAQLRWEGSWGGADTDLDLYLVALSGNTFILPDDAVAQSVTAQSGRASDVPFERIRIGYGDIPNGVYCLAVVKHSGEAPNWVQVLAWGASGALQHHTAAHSITNPAESSNPGLLAVGAAGRNSSISNPFDTTIIEPFSSRGPTLDDRTKPDIVGADAGQSVTYRTERNLNGYFFGTSQASPHVAGLAALVRQRFPQYSPQQTAQYLKDNAAPRGAAGADNIWGHGFAHLPASDAPTLTSTATPVPSPTPEPTATPTSTPSSTPEPTATPTLTPSPTPKPTATSTPTPSPTPESPDGSEIENRVKILEALIVTLQNAIDALTSRVAALELGASQPTPTPTQTPTPTATPLPPGVTPEPTATAEPTATPEPDPCFIDVPASSGLPIVLSGSWTQECVYSLSRERIEEITGIPLAAGARYYRYTGFEVTAVGSGAWTATLESSKDTALFLWEWDEENEGRVFVAGNDDIVRGNTNSKVSWTPTGGKVYYIDMTTYEPQTLGDFTLTVSSGSSGTQGMEVRGIQHDAMPSRLDRR